ncbi:hypothetical protein [Actinopolymorpha pittospori]|uniref:Uncharacterized protein n=1 Tax=Actinopolymorpha pittospori TaxID=648752 RepID=A0A927MZ54_9ACTN|nr:hypothetical protein [Actinopolymorpha pittospori]MBE1609236.1 hypothetical protein [Actinopolymorpha pittospori]
MREPTASARGARAGFATEDVRRASALAGSAAAMFGILAALCWVWTITSLAGVGAAASWLVPTGFAVVLTAATAAFASLWWILSGLFRPTRSARRRG